MANSKITIRKMMRDEVLALPSSLWAATSFPLEYIRGINLDVNRMEAIERCTHPEHGFSAKVESDGGTVYFLAELLPWDSEHFGLKTIRIEHVLLEPSAGVAGNPRTLFKNVLPVWNGFLLDHGAEYAFGTFDCKDNMLVAELSCAGYVPLEIRVNYWRTLSSYQYPKRYGVRLGVESDLESLEAAPVSNINPLDRFHADPALSPDKVDELMRLWVRNSLLHGFADGVLVPDMSPPDAFCTYRLRRNQWEYWGVKAAQPILAAVSPNRSGWYVKMMSELSYHLRNEGADCAFMTTQLGNLAVIRAWQALGFGFGSGEIILRWLPT